MPDSANTGDVFLVGDDVYIFGGDTWEPMGDVPMESDRRRIPVHTNCVNCGAPLSECVCEYCGTHNNEAEYIL